MVLLLVVSTFIVAILVDYIVVKKLVQRKARQTARGYASTISVSGTGQSPRIIYYPEKLHFDRSHTWASIEPSDVTVGLDDFTQRFTGPIDRIECVNVGDMVKKGQPIWTLHFGSRTITQRAPISGRVSQINEEALRDPSLVNQSPYSKGWVLKIQPESLHEEASSLMDQGQFKEWNHVLKDRLLENMYPALGVVYGDRGEMVHGAAKEIKPEKWGEVVDFLFNTK